MIATVQNTSDQNEIKHFSEWFHHTFKVKGGASRQEVLAKIKALEEFIESLNDLLATRLVKDNKELLSLMNMISKLTGQKEDLEWTLMSDEEKSNSEKWQSILAEKPNPPSAAREFWNEKNNRPSPAMRNSSFHPVKSALLGLVVGDALGVPVEFSNRNALEKRPVTDMIGFGTYNQPPGTWSDDSSLALCLAEVLTEGFDLQKLANSFVDWLFRNRWTAHGRVFDVGMATREAIHQLAKGVEPQLAGGKDEYSNGNGSLMRILPLLFFSHDKSLEERFELAKAVSSLTHAHPRSIAACFYYLEFARLILNGVGKFEAYSEANRVAGEALAQNQATRKELSHFQRILTGALHNLQAHEIRGSGYVVHTLEASLWCVLTSETYREAVLKAVNLGEDTDTTGAVTGGIAGLIFGGNDIPVEWIGKIARLADIEELAERLAKKYG